MIWQEHQSSKLRSNLDRKYKIFGKFFLFLQVTQLLLAVKMFPAKTNTDTDMLFRLNSLMIPRTNMRTDHHANIYVCHQNFH